MQHKLSEEKTAVGVSYLKRQTAFELVPVTLATTGCGFLLAVVAESRSSGVGGVGMCK